MGLGERDCRELVRARGLAVRPALTLGVPRFNLSRSSLSDSPGLNRAPPHNTSARDRRLGDPTGTSASRPGDLACARGCRQLPLGYPVGVAPAPCKRPASPGRPGLDPMQVARQKNAGQHSWSLRWRATNASASSAPSPDPTRRVRWRVLSGISQVVEVCLERDPALEENAELLRPGGCHRDPAFSGQLRRADPGFRIANATTTDLRTATRVRAPSQR